MKLPIERQLPVAFLRHEKFPTQAEMSASIRLLSIFVALRVSDFGPGGNREISTPHIGRFARGSVQFDRFFVNPACARPLIRTRQKIAVTHRRAAGASAH